MTRLSVNINKIATLRNARGGAIPNVIEAAKKIQEFGAQGITVHPRPDERHITYQDIADLRPVVKTEFNIEGNPIRQFIDLVMHNSPEQVTLVPDARNAITSNAGWDTVKEKDYLIEVVKEFKRKGIRISIFVDPEEKMIHGAKKIGADRIELYTENFASEYEKGNKKAVEPYVHCAKVAHELGLGINAGHDLSLENLAYFHQEVPFVEEVSIGHALIAEALYEGLESVIKKYRNILT